MVAKCLTRSLREEDVLGSQSKGSSVVLGRYDKWEQEIACSHLGRSKTRDETRSGAGLYPSRPTPQGPNSSRKTPPLKCSSTLISWGPTMYLCTYVHIGTTHVPVGAFYSQTMTSGLIGNVLSEMFPRAPDQAIYGKAGPAAMGLCRP